MLVCLSQVTSVKAAVGLDSAASGGETVSAYLVRYLLHLGITRIFSVPGDFTLPLMADIERHAGDRLPFILSLNELNCGYAADGYARVRGLSVLMVTYSVGSLSAINAIAGMYCENVPCLVIVGGPNSNSGAEGEVVHHTLGEVRYDYSRRMAAEVTAKATTVTRAADFPARLQEAIEAALNHRKPVYLEVSSNLSSAPIAPLTTPPAPLPSLRTLYQLDRVSDPETLTSAVNAAVTLLNSASRPLVLGGGNLRHLKSGTAPVTEETTSAGWLTPLINLLERSGFPYAAMMDAKAMLPEDNPSYIGVYAGGVGILPGHPEGGGLVQSIVEAADAVLLIGCVLSDYATAGHAMKLPSEAMRVEVEPNLVKVAGAVYHRVGMKDFLHHLVSGSRLKGKSPLLEEFKERVQKLDREGMKLSAEVERMVAERRTKYPLNLTPSAPLTMRSIQHHLQQWLTTSNSTPLSTSSTHPSTSPQPPAHIVVDCGDSWMTGLKLRLPHSGSFTMQLQYGSLGWGTGAALGTTLALLDQHRRGRVVLITGDGGYQMSPQEVSTLLRYHCSLIVLIMANGTYLVENEITPGDFNDLVSWDYVALFKAFTPKGGPAPYAVRAETNEGLRQALEEVRVREGVCMVEVALARDDCNEELTEWAQSLHPSASRPPRV